ncbi:hypothetical protein P700755_000957 [Psychroflexus torquis ATCC 700755]|uniref:Uncharacterized protein n=1 Tax=Psychroflexus torquis (strain ATCC 700755 / CIP 106069 / ACAM 623) TaxID=313595 RepID=K4IR19_PSYTT|nr:hypothetical protein [Psychroflexus torquis]AFU67930.1 hypothetical protein P700755_000957 [Psychroflexus torquis ATCC 700755]
MNKIDLNKIRPLDANLDFSRFEKLETLQVQNKKLMNIVLVIGLSFTIAIIYMALLESQKEQETQL